MQFQYFDFTNL